MEFVPFQRPKGRPLLVFATVIGGWLALRVLLWEPPFGGAAPTRTTDDRASDLAISGGTAKVHASTMKHATLRRSDAPPAPHLASDPSAEPASRVLALPAERAVEIVPGLAGHIAQGTVTAQPKASEAGRSAKLKIASGPSNSRWSGEAWLLLRKGPAAQLVPRRPAYGRSQAGAVLRYRVGPANGHHPSVYVRATRALAGPGEREVAAGLAARPLPRLPVSVAAEVRVHEHPAGSEARAAAFAVTELPPVRLPFAFRGELYAQAGYVGGRFATAFADGQLRVDRVVAERGAGTELRLGGAISGGAQKHAARLDVGPSAIVSIPLGGAYSRLALDYRFRIAGDAEPGNGPALTFSAGF